MLKFIIASIIPARETGHGWGILIEHGLYTPILIFNFLCRCVNFHNKNPGAGKPYKTPLLNELKFHPIFMRKNRKTCHSLLDQISLASEIQVAVFYGIELR